MSLPNEIVKAMLRNAFHDNTEQYRAFSEAMRPLEDEGVYPGGVWVDNGQRVVKLKLDQNKPLSQQRALLRFLPLIKPVERRDGPLSGEQVLRVRIFEETLAEHGLYTLYVTPDHRVHLTKTSYSTEHLVRSFDNIKGAMKYVYKHHPYERRHAD
jgi:hypothetical protein